MLTVVCLYVKGPYGYTPEYVVRLERMARRFLARPFDFVCLVDSVTRRELERTADAGRVRLIEIESLAGVVPHNGVGYWNKLRVFDPAIGFTGRVLFLDLDTLVVAALDPIVDFPARLVLTTDAFVVERAHLTTDRYQRTLVRRFNSSVMVWDGGAYPELWTSWTPAEAQRLSTDQDWIGEQAVDAQGMPLEWFPRISHLVRDETFAATGQPMPADAKVVLVKKPKNAPAAELWPWLKQAWGGWAA